MENSNSFFTLIGIILAMIAFLTSASEEKVFPRPFIILLLAFLVLFVADQIDVVEHSQIIPV